MGNSENPRRKSPKLWRTFVLLYGGAVVGVALATWARLLLDPLAGDHSRYATLLFAVLVIAAYAGGTPALTALMLGALSVDYFLIPRTGELVTYACAGLGIALICGFMRASSLVHADDRERVQQNITASPTRKDYLTDMLLESLPGVLYVVDDQGRFLRWNKKLEMVSGYSATEISSLIFLDLCDEPDKEIVAKAMKQAFLTGEAATEAVLVAKDQTKTHYFFTGKLVQIDGKPCLTGMGINMTAQKRAESKFRDLLEAAPDASVISDREGRIVLVNSQAETIFGYARTELIGQQIEMLLPDCSRDKHRKHRDGYFAHPNLRPMGVGLDLHGRRKDGIEFPVEISLSPLETAEGSLVISAVRDITERKQAEQELGESTQRLNSIVTSAMDAIVTADQDKRIVLANLAAEKMFGYTAAELLGQPLDLLMPQRFHAEHSVRIEAFGRTGVTARRVGALNPVTGLRKNGEEFPIEASVSKAKSGGKSFFTAILRDIAERQRTEESLRQNEEKLRGLYSLSPLGIALTNSKGRFLEVNEAFQRMCGYTQAELKALDYWALTPRKYEAEEARQLESLKSIGKYGPYEKEYIRKDGGLVPLRLNGMLITGSDGEKYIWSIVEDITERRLAETRIKYLNRVQAMLSGINTLIVRVHDRDELFREACRIAVEVGGFRMAWIGILDRTATKIIPVASAGGDEQTPAAIKDYLATEEGPPLGSTVAARVIRERKAFISNEAQSDPTILLGKRYIETGIRSMAMLPLIVGDEALGMFALYASDTEFFHHEEVKLLTELAGDVSFAIDHIEKQERLDYLAYYDSVTGLANRTLFHERLTQSVAHASEHSLKFALVLLDIERFKAINDTLGRPIGDGILREFTARTSALVDVHRLARFDADHFAVITADVQSDQEVARLIEKRIDQILRPPFRIGETELRVTAKFGIALFPGDGADADTLLKNAEAALKKSKASGTAYMFYTQAMNDRVAEMFSFENKLREGLDKGEFVLHYQPKVSLGTGEITGAEALIRWNDPQTGLVPPSRFVPILEETGLISEIGNWALQQALEDYLRWRKAGQGAVRIAVNVSALQLLNHDFAGEIERIISTDPHAAAGLELEITESLMMGDLQRSISTLKAIRSKGVTIAIDDFGTGFSSLSHVAKLPVNTLKIDRSFVIAMTAGPEGLALVSTIINLAHSLKLKVVAEGVETEEQSRLLRLLNCDEMQGYLFSKPVPRETFEAKFLGSSRIRVPAA